MGYWEYAPLVDKYQVPIVVTGFEPVDIMQGILAAVKQLEKGETRADNAYARAVTFEGNRPAQDTIAKVFQQVDRKWRGIGMIPMSGWGLRPEYVEFDAEKRFSVEDIKAEESPLCIAGLILQGVKKPADCSAFGGECTPEHPLGATMVSNEGACAAYYRYRLDLTPL
jgi:hydrogenase expression/formation protein HypD